MAAIEKAGYKPGEDVVLALDCAATEFFKDGKYELEGEGKTLDPRSMVEYLAELVASYPIVSIEDGMARGRLGGLEGADRRARRPKCQLVGDDLFVTNTTRLSRASTRASPTRSWSRSTRSAR